MDATEIRNEIIRIMDLFGMTAKRGAEIAKISHDSFRHRIRGSRGYYFSEEHLHVLKQFIKKMQRSFEIALISMSF